MLFMSRLPNLREIRTAPVSNITGLWEVRCYQRMEKEISEKYSAIKDLNSFPDEEIFVEHSDTDK